MSRVSKITKTKEQCRSEFWISLCEATQKAGGNISLIIDPSMTVHQLGMNLAQNGIRFTYRKCDTVNE